MNLETLQATLSTQLNNLAAGTILVTPDSLRMRQFTVLRYRDDALFIETQGGTLMQLPLQAFLRTLIHMHASGSCAQNPSLIRSSNLEPPEGGLCDVSRGPNGETRWITYVLPVLEYLGWVQIDGNQRPNTSWLLP